MLSQPGTPLVLTCVSAAFPDWAESLSWSPLWGTTDLRLTMDDSLAREGCSARSCMLSGLDNPVLRAGTRVARQLRGTDLP
jgi:hypothetical protein